MEKEAEKEENTLASKKGYRLLSRVNKGQDITVRDDQYSFPWLLDSVKRCRQKGFRFRLIDSSKLDRFQLEWLAEAGTDLYTSDEARADLLELELVTKACKRGGSIFAYFHHGPLESEGSEDKSSSVSFSDLQYMGGSGIYLYITNRDRERNFSKLNELAHACRRGRSWLVYYHHGPIDPSFEELGGSGTWIHITDQSLQGSEDTVLVLDGVKDVLSSGARLVLHLENMLEFLLLRDIIEAGVFVLFKTSLFDYTSPFKDLEKKAKQKKLDFRAYYLYPDFLP